MIAAMKTCAKVAGGLLCLLLVLLAFYLVYARTVINPRVVEELRANPEGSRAERAMLITLADGRLFPVNYLREGNRIFMGIDGFWWRAFTGAGAPVTLFIQGATYQGHARAIVDQPEYTREVFRRLRPSVPSWLPDGLNGKLVVVTLD